MKVTSKLLTLAELLELDPPPRFSVPIYQRLYVWGEDQIRTLLEDINTAFCQRKPIFFLGGTLVVEREDRHGRHFELIDGQQRFTTLWMIAAAWRKAMEPFLGVTVDGLIQPRLQFAIRLEVIKSLEKDGMDATRQPLSDILEPAVPEETTHATGDPSGVDEEGDRVRSIVGFPVFLQHVLRIWLQEQNYPDIPRILDRELLTLFENHFFQASSDNAELRRANVRSFISLLWELRYLFDKHTIKWVDLGEEEMHLICSLRLTKSGNYLSLTRDQEETGDTRGFSLLQSMLYHSQQITTQYWLTPLLAFIKKHKGGVNRYYRYLRHLDNHLFSSNDEVLLIERTRGFLEEFWKARPLSAPPVLREPLGVKFPHYWFYKLEFILWFQGPERHGIEKRDQAQCWRSFHFTAKNSVEHISPQTPQEVDRTVLSRTTLDRFGNLALVSRSVNSEYSNLPFDEKRARFWNRNQSKLDSLKMALIYSEEDWGDQEASRHETRMLEAFEEYFATEHAQAQL